MKYQEGDLEDGLKSGGVMYLDYYYYFSLIFFFLFIQNMLILYTSGYLLYRRYGCMDLID